MAADREHFGSRFAAVAAMAGSAIGLGNIWRFPYMVGEYGGAAFIVIYILCSLLISLPIFFCEAVIGRKAHLSTFDALSKLAPGTAWKWLGTVAVAASFIIVSYYCVVGGWSVDYLVRSFAGSLNAGTQAATSALFGKVATSVWEPLIAFTVFLGISAVIVVLGVHNGIEKFAKVCMPLLFVLIVAIMVYSLTLPGSEAGVRYLAKPDFSRITPRSFSYAMGQSFFSLSLGVGCVLTYASYMKKEESLLSVGAWTLTFDTFFAIVAGFAVMPAVFSARIEPGAGPSLVFETLPFIFSSMAESAPVLSYIVTVLFFVTILVAAFTSSISMLEVCVSFLMERTGLSRGKSSVIVFTSSWILGVLCSLSFGVLGGVKLFGLTIFNFCDTLTSNYLMTLGALVFALFVGWKLDRPSVREELLRGCSGRGAEVVFSVLYFLVKWIVPVAILAIFLTNLFV